MIASRGWRGGGSFRWYRSPRCSGRCWFSRAALPLGLPVILARNRHADPGIEPGDQLLPHWLGRTIGVERRYRAVRAFPPSVAVWFAVLDVAALFHLDDFTLGPVATGAYY